MKLYRNTVIDVLVMIGIGLLLSVIVISANAAIGDGTPFTSDINMKGDGTNKNNVKNAATVSGDNGAFTTSLSGTANAQNQYVTGTHRASILMVTNPSSASVSVGGASTANTVSASVAGGVYNGDFSLGTSGWSASGSLTESNGVGTITSAGGWVYCYNAQKIPLVPTKSYKFSMKSYMSTGTNNPLIAEYDINGNLTNSWEGAYTHTTWTATSYTFAAHANTNYVLVYPIRFDDAASGYATDIKLEQVDSSITTKPPVTTLVYPTITGVTSEFVDQSQLLQDTGMVIGDSGGTDFQIDQSFTTSKTQTLTALSLFLKRTNTAPSGNLIIEIRENNPADGKPSSTIIASSDVEASSLASLTTAYAYRTFPIFGLLSANTKYHFKLRSDINESTSVYYGVGLQSSNPYSGGQFFFSTNSGVDWTLASEDSTFKTHYSQNTNNIQISTEDTPNQTKLNFGDTGLPDGAVVDLERGKFNWTLANSYDGLNRQANVITTVSAGGYTTTPTQLNGWIPATYGGQYYWYANGAGSLTYCINTGAAIIGNVTASVIMNSNNGSTNTWSYSKDGVNWTIFAPDSDSLAFTPFTYVFSGLQGFSGFYIKASGSAGNPSFALRSIEADIDTGQLDYPVVTRTGSNRILTSVNGGSYRATVSDKYYTQSLQTALESNGEEISKLQSSNQSERDRLTGNYLVKSASGALVPANGLINNETGTGFGTAPTTQEVVIRGTGTSTGVNFQTQNSSGTPLVTGLDNGWFGLNKTPTSVLDIVGTNGIAGGDTSIKSYSADRNNYVRLDRGDTSKDSAITWQDAGVDKWYMGQISTSLTSWSLYSSAKTGGAGNVITVLNTGNVGIGTTSPLVTLHVYKGGVSSDPIITSGDSGYNSGYGFYSGTDHKWSIYRAATSHDLRIYSSSAVRDVFSIVSTGSVVIGTVTATPAGMLTVNGGSGWATGGWSSPSVSSMKTNIDPVTSETEDTLIQALRDTKTYLFNWKPEPAPVLSSISDVTTIQESTKVIDVTKTVDIVELVEIPESEAITRITLPNPVIYDPTSMTNSSDALYRFKDELNPGVIQKDGKYFKEKITGTKIVNVTREEIIKEPVYSLPADAFEAPVTPELTITTDYSTATAPAPAPRLKKEYREKNRINEETMHYETPVIVSVTDVVPVTKEIVVKKREDVYKERYAAWQKKADNLKRHKVAGIMMDEQSDNPLLSLFAAYDDDGRLVGKNDSEAIGALLTIVKKQQEMIDALDARVKILEAK